MPPLTREPPPTPRPTYTDMSSKFTRSRTPGYGADVPVDDVQPEEGGERGLGAGAEPHGALVGAVVEQKTLPSEPGVFQSRPISRTRVRMPACAEAEGGDGGAVAGADDDGGGVCRRRRAPRPRRTGRPIRVRAEGGGGLEGHHAQDLTSRQVCCHGRIMGGSCPPPMCGTAHIRGTVTVAPPVASGTDRPAHAAPPGLEQFPQPLRQQVPAPLLLDPGPAPLPHAAPQLRVCSRATIRSAAASAGAAPDHPARSRRPGPRPARRRSRPRPPAGPVAEASR